MGLQLDTMCCINNEDIVFHKRKQQDEQCYNNSCNGNNDSDDTTSQFIPIERNLNNTYTKPHLPSSEIKFYTNNDYMSIKRVKSLSTLPISTNNVIRKHIGDPLDKYDVIKQLGKGSYGHVFKVMNKQTKNPRAMKLIPKNNMKPGFTADEIKHEIRVLTQLDHPNIIKLYEFYSDNDNYYLINEYCNEGDLSSKFRLIKKFPECIVKVIMIQLLTAVMYLHSNRIIHGDLKMENILIDAIKQSCSSGKADTFITAVREDSAYINTNKNECYDDTTSNSDSSCSNMKNSKNKYKYRHLKNFYLKLIDFGCSKIFTPYKNNFADTIGTLVYCAPEVIQNNYNEKCDIWSCGVIMYALLTGKFPFNGHSQREIVQNIINGKYDLHCNGMLSLQAKDLIHKCLIYDKDKRINAYDALTHPFFTQNIDIHNIFQEKIDMKECLVLLMNYSKRKKVYQMVLAYLSHNYNNKEEVSRIKKVFAYIDLNVDGKISRDELYRAYLEVGIDVEKETVNEIVNCVDFNEDGFIEYEEFVRVLLPREELFKEVYLKEAFDMLDLEGRGKVSIEDVVKVLGVNKDGEHKGNKVYMELVEEMKELGFENSEMTFNEFKAMFVNDKQ